MHPFQKVTLAEKAGYGLGELANNAYLGVLSLFILYYYTDVFGINPAAAGLLLLSSRAFDAITDPAMGIIADRTSSRWGKYRPYLLWGAPPLALASVLVFLGPDLSDIGKLVFAYVTLGLFMLLFTAVSVSYSALMTVMSPTSQGRVEVAQVRFMLGHIGTLLVGALAMPLVNQFGQGDDRLGFILMIATLSTFALVCYAISFFAAKERVAPEKNRTATGDIRALLNNKNWRVLFFISCLTLVGLVCRVSSIIYYFKYHVLESAPRLADGVDPTAVFTAIGFLGPILGAFISPFLTKRFEKYMVILVMNGLHAFLLATCFFIPPEMFALNVMLHFLGLTTFGVTLTMLFAMYTDCAVFEQWTSGENTAGLTQASLLFAMKFGSAGGAAIPGFTLGIVGFIANEVQTEQAILGIQLMFTVIPALLFLSAALLALFYKLDRATIESIEAELHQERAET